MSNFIMFILIIILFLISRFLFDNFVILKNKIVNYEKQVEKYNEKLKNDEKELEEEKIISDKETLEEKIIHDKEISENDVEVEVVVEVDEKKIEEEVISDDEKEICKYDSFEF